MGKKSDKFMNDITQLLGECQEPLTLTVRVVCEMEIKMKAQEKAIKERDYDTLQELGIEHTTLYKQGKAAAKTLQTALGALKKKLAEFETYVDNKAKSINPFTSKKSIPSSRTFIKNTEVFLADAEQYARRWN